MDADQTEDNLARLYPPWYGRQMRDRKGLFKTVMNWVVFPALVILAIVCVTGFVAILIFAYLFEESQRPKIDPGLYKEVVAKRIEWSPKYRFLPQEVPADASKVAFFHIPHFLQGGDIVILRVALPESQVKETFESLVSNGRKEVTVERINDCALPEFGMRRPGLKNMFEGVSELSGDFRVFLFESDMDEIRKDWNHNFLAFTAVSIERGEVVYYVNWW